LIHAGYCENQEKYKEKTWALLLKVPQTYGELATHVFRKVRGLYQAVRAKANMRRGWGQGADHAHHLKEGSRECDIS
jgi:ERCC4-type nuclease